MYSQKCVRKCSIKTKYYSTHAHQKQTAELNTVKGLLFDVRVDKQFNFVLLKVQIKFEVKNDLC